MSLERAPPRAVAGSSASRTARGPSKCTSPPKARVTAWPLPLQPGDSGEPVPPLIGPDGVASGGGDGEGRAPPPPPVPPPPPPQSIEGPAGPRGPATSPPHTTA